jgi:hypothetical protein
MNNLAFAYKSESPCIRSHLRFEEDQIIPKLIYKEQEYQLRQEKDFHMSILQELIQNIDFGPTLRENVVKFLVAHGCAETAGHSMQVAAEARRIAKQFDLNPAWAEMVGWLHDISTVIPKEQRVIVAEQVGIGVLEAERIFPMINSYRLSIRERGKSIRSLARKFRPIQYLCVEYVRMREGTQSV